MPQSRKNWTARSERSGAQSSTPLNARRCFAGTEAAPWSSMCARGLPACPSRLGTSNARCTTASAPFVSRSLKRAIGSGARHVSTRLARIASSRTSGLSSTPAPRTPARTYPPTPTPIARCVVSLLTRRRRRRRSWRRRQTGAVASKKALPRPPKKTPPRPPRQQQHRRPGAAPLPSPRLASQRLPRAARQAAAAACRRLPSRRLPPRCSAQASPTTFAGQTVRRGSRSISSSGVPSSQSRSAARARSATGRMRSSPWSTRTTPPSCWSSATTRSR
mmetsp:Transcript_67205/g.162398  ORF Transcript_67205/g.162398 Transcript_67205/m.162398 type:complete len:276 (+) Transcript_67205:638-1465(+)